MRPDPRLCLSCRGAKYLCGLAYCPIVVKAAASLTFERVGREVQGSSPPSIFVGRSGYPKITVYPSAPPQLGTLPCMRIPEVG